MTSEDKLKAIYVGTKPFSFKCSVTALSRIFFTVMILMWNNPLNHRTKEKSKGKPTLSIGSSFTGSGTASYMDAPQKNGSAKKQKKKFNPFIT